MTYVLLIIGFALLIKGADYFVEGSSNIATLLKIPPLLVGLTIVALGTSSPEATVSILAALEGSADVAVGNVVGSNIFNITFVIGLTALLNPLKVESTTIRKEIPFTLLASVALLVLMADIFLQNASSNLITRSDGLIFLLFFSVFMYYIIEIALNSRDTKSENPTVHKKGAWGKNIFFTILGLAAIIYGGNLVVKSSTEIALALGMSQTLVGLTIIAVGTSLPELITSVTASIKKQSEIALGNIVGSNIFNILFVLGTTSIISPLPVDSKIFSDVLFMIAFTIVLLVFSISRSRVGRYEGMTLAIAYIVYMVYIIIRN
ncbi:calcium/sodium antiporter [Bacillus sp. PS06]|uniref:calcium/sodium antiporter n=1 Tax=Bacillus sp. PS06 TaxID=2764176 RepID=UPI00177DE669|nr:calcium/sodium antiporter [Bacillus sp. PS06]MBD8067399.1 calcium/sodium antiporter [Bacillus sp. PS06]